MNLYLTGAQIYRILRVMYSVNFRVKEHLKIMLILSLLSTLHVQICNSIICFKNSTTYFVSQYYEK